MNNVPSWFHEASQKRLETISVELKREELIQTISSTGGIVDTVRRLGKGKDI